MHPTSDLDRAENAFLLGVAPGDDTTLAVANIEKSDGVVTLTASRSLPGLNGEVYVMCGSSLGGITVKQSVEAVDDDNVNADDKGKRVIVPLSGEPSAAFYKLCVGYPGPAPAVPSP